MAPTEKRLVAHKPGSRDEREARFSIERTIADGQRAAESKLFEQSGLTADDLHLLAKEGVSLASIYEAVREFGSDWRKWLFRTENIRVLEGTADDGDGERGHQFQHDTRE